MHIFGEQSERRKRVHAIFLKVSILISPVKLLNFAIDIFRAVTHESLAHRRA